MFDIILKELKADFPGQRTITLEQCGDMIGGRSKEALYKLKKRGRLDIPHKKIGGKYIISIHAFAKYLAELNEPEEEAQEVEGVKKHKAVKPNSSGKTSISTLTGKDILRNTAPLSKGLFNTFAKAIEKMEDELEFHKELYRVLEHIELSRSVPDAKRRNMPPF